MFTSLSRQGTNKFPYILHPSSTHPSSIQLANLFAMQLSTQSRLLQCKEVLHQHGAWNLMVPQRKRYDQLWEEKHGWQAQKWENKNRANILQHGVPNMDLQTNKGQYRMTGPQKKALLQIDRRLDYTRMTGPKCQTIDYVHFRLQFYRGQSLGEVLTGFQFLLLK